MDDAEIIHRDRCSAPISCWSHSQSGNPTLRLRGQAQAGGSFAAQRYRSQASDARIPVQFIVPFNRTEVDSAIIIIFSYVLQAKKCLVHEARTVRSKRLHWHPRKRKFASGTSALQSAILGPRGIRQRIQNAITEKENVTTWTDPIRPSTAPTQVFVQALES